VFYYPAEIYPKLSIKAFHGVTDCHNGKLGMDQANSATNGNAIRHSLGIENSVIGKARKLDDWQVFVGPKSAILLHVPILSTTYLEGVGLGRCQTRGKQCTLSL
jgi:hypothetical protein